MIGKKTAGSKDLSELNGKCEFHKDTQCRHYQYTGILLNTYPPH